MFLAAIYPLSEKSALNLSGKVNTNNLTYFESEVEYLTNAGCPPPALDTATADTADTAVQGIAEAKGESDDDDALMDIEKGDDAELAAPEIAYDLYKAFWRLQVCKLLLYCATARQTAEEYSAPSLVPRPAMTIHFRRVFSH
jgi:hypothetical protein